MSATFFPATTWLMLPCWLAYPEAGSSSLRTRIKSSQAVSVGFAVCGRLEQKPTAAWNPSALLMSPSLLTWHRLSH